MKKRRRMKMTIPEQFEDRIMNLARAHNQEVEEESIDFLKFVLDMEEDYVSQRLRGRVPEQV